MRQSLFSIPVQIIKLLRWILFKDFGICWKKNLNRLIFQKKKNKNLVSWRTSLESSGELLHVDQVLYQNSYPL